MTRISLKHVKLSCKALHALVQLFPNLEVLFLVDCGLTNSHLREIAKLKRLDALNIRENPLIGNKGMQALWGLENLTRFQVGPSRYLTDKGMAGIRVHTSYASFINMSGCQQVKGAFLSENPNLAILNMGNCTKMAASAFKAIRQMSFLFKLVLSGVPAVNEENLRGIQLSSLGVLHVSQCNNLNDMALKIIGQWKMLLELDASHCPSLTDEGIATALCELHRLQEVNLVGSNVWTKTQAQLPRMERLRACYF